VPHPDCCNAPKSALAAVDATAPLVEAVNKHSVLFPLRKRDKNLRFTSWLAVPSADPALVSEVLLVDERPFLGVLSPSTFQTQAATSTEFSTPGYAAPSGFLNLLALLFRPRSFGLVSCRIRPWGCDFQRFLPPRSHHGFHRALPLVPRPRRNVAEGCGNHAPGRFVHNATSVTR